MIHIVAFGCGLKCPRKIRLNTQWGEGIHIPGFLEEKSFASIPAKFGGRLLPPYPPPPLVPTVLVIRQSR